jgi:apolipoprotein D and lipocalin family protein
MTARYLAVAALLAACSGGETYRDTSVEMTTVAEVDLDRYLGRWYEIARYPNSFEEGCVAVSADYALRDDGAVSVLNTCRKTLDDPDPTTAEGVARPADATNARLKVTFVPWLGPLAEGDYWILGLSDGYTVSVVGAPSGGTGWILARTPQIAAADLQFAHEALSRNGYDIEQLSMTPQPTP